MLLKELLKQAGLPASKASWQGELEITSLTADSRCVERGALFVAIRGLSLDGHAYASEAISKGASFVISERALGDLPHLTVENSREALARLFDAWYGHPAASLEMIGVTGTNGKTSTATMIYSILRHAGLSVGLIGTVCSLCNDEELVLPNKDALANMTTPDPEQLYALLAIMRDKGVKYVVMEVTSHALALSKTAPLFWKRAVFTNLTPDHLDLHGDMESYFLEKCKLFSSCEGAVVSCLSPYGIRLADSLGVPLYPICENSLSQVVKRGSAGVSFRLCTPKGEWLALDLPVPGEFSVENGGLAAMTALSLGIGEQTVKQALERFEGVKGRLQRVGENRLGISVFLDYAHTPDALEKLLRCVRDFKGGEGRILLLFGCGGDRDRSKRAVMGRIASRLADFLILTSDNCRSEDPDSILREILRGVDKEKPHIVLPDRRAAIAYGVRIAKKGDILLLVGKGHECYEICGGERRFFCEADIVAECMSKREEGRS